MKSEKAMSAKEHAEEWMIEGSLAAQLRLQAVETSAEKQRALLFGMIVFA